MAKGGKCPTTHWAGCLLAPAGLARADGLAALVGVPAEGVDALAEGDGPALLPRPAHRRADGPAAVRRVEHPELLLVRAVVRDRAVAVLARSPCKAAAAEAGTVHRGVLRGPGSRR